MSHSPFGPSVFSRRMACPASYQMEEGIPDQPSAAAEEGTAAHQLAEKMLISYSRDAQEYLGREFNGYVVDHDMAHYVQQYVDRVYEHVDAGGHLYVEQRIDYDRWVPGGYGTTDAGILFPQERRAVIRDLKFGRGVKVFAKGNPQPMLYGLGFWSTYGFMYDIDHLDLEIDQPRLGHVDTWRVSMDEILAFAEEATKVYEAATGPDPEFKPGEEQCRFCKAAAVCKARAAWLIDSVGVEFDFDTGAWTIPSVDTLQDDEIGRIYGHLDDFSNWIKAVKAYTELLLVEGHSIPGWKLVMGGRRTRYWKDEKAAESVMLESGMDPMDMYVKKIPSPAQAEKRIGKGAIEDLVAWTEGKPTVAPETDDREAVGSVAEDFDYD